MVKYVNDDKNKDIIKNIEQIFWTKPVILTSEHDMKKVLNETIDELTKIIHGFLAQGSNWQIQNIYDQYLNIHTYKPLGGSSYISLPKELQNPMKGLINIQNEDKKCFMYCHLYHLHKYKIKSDPQRVSKYKKYENDCDLDYTDIEFPVKINQFNKIEKMNNIRINVFGYENKQVFPLYIRDVQNTNEMNLLLIDNNEGKRHYVYIKKFDRLMYSKTKHKKYFCMYCLHCFSTEEILNNHEDYCLKINGKQNIKMPAEGLNIYFKNFYKTSESPFAIYADFESLLVPQSIEITPNSPVNSYTNKYQEHKICSYAYKVVCCVDKQYTKPIKMSRGSDAAYKLIKDILHEEKKIQKIIKRKFNKPLEMTSEDIKDFNESDKCWIYNNKYIKNDIRVRDHEHVTGKYRGSAHKMCNLKFRLSTKVPVIFHNLRGYDSHFIIQEIGKFYETINVIPTNTEKYLSIQLGKNIIFIDSFQFMSSSLDRLAGNLPRDKYIYTSEDSTNINLLKRKGVYPYEYMDSFEKFNETQLPDKSKFYSSLYDNNISNDDYIHA